MCFEQNKGDLCRHLMCSLSLPCSRRILANLVDCGCSRFGNLINCVKQRQSLRISGSLHCPPHPHSLGSRRSRSRGRQVGLAPRIMTSPASRRFLSGQNYYRVIGDYFGLQAYFKPPRTSLNTLFICKKSSIKA